LTIRLDLNYLSPGFDDLELGSQQAFRAMVEALDHPGHSVQIRSKLSVPGDLNDVFLTYDNILAVLPQST
jgi:alpha-D-ribose 1-methylphosphonate 5-triphosphate synthase subunit PhnH